MVDINEVYHMESIIKQALLVVKKQKQKQKYIIGFLTRTLVQEENELKNKIDFWIREFYMLNPRHIGLQNLLTIEPNRIIQDMKAILYESFEDLNLLARVHDLGHYIDEKTLSELKKEKQKIIEKIMEYTKNSVNDFIKLIENAPEKIDVNEKMVAGVNKTCIDVIQAEDSEKLHEVLEDLDSVIFILPAEYMRRGGPLPVNYKYLAYTYKKNYITSWFNTPARIKYCDTDTDTDNQFFKKKTPYVLSPLNFNCDPAYIKLWEIVHIIHSTQRVFYVLPSHSENLKHTCMKDDKESHQILKIAICDGPDCWKWDKNTGCIQGTDAEKIEIQKKCNTRTFDRYMERTKRLEDLEKNRVYYRKLKEDFHGESLFGKIEKLKRKNPESDSESDSERDPESVQSAKYKKII